MYEGWTIVFPKNILTNFDDIIRAETEELAIKRGMMERAERKPVPYDRFTLRVTIWHNVCRV